jgi:hypothetical protein
VFCAAQLAEVHRSFAADGITVDATAFAALFGLEELPWFGPRLARAFALAQTHEAASEALHLAPEQFAQVCCNAKDCSIMFVLSTYNKLAAFAIVQLSLITLTLS